MAVQYSLGKLLGILRQSLRHELSVNDFSLLLYHKRRKLMTGFLHIKKMSEERIHRKMNYSQVEETFFKYLQHKDVTCDKDERLGFQHDGGWNVCLTEPFKLQKPCLVYSFGIGKDWRFEDDIQDFYGCEVVAFDPSLNMKEHDRTNLTHFYPLGLAGSNYVTKQGWVVQTFHQHLVDRGHEHTIIDYLKIDIEFMEWKVLQNILPDLKLVKQLGFEIHLTIPDHKMDTNVTMESYKENYKILKKLEKINMKKFNYRLNPFGSFQSNRTGKQRSAFYELHYLNFDFVKEKHLKYDK